MEQVEQMPIKNYTENNMEGAAPLMQETADTQARNFANMK